MVVENISVISKEDAYHALYVTSKRSLMVKYIQAGLFGFFGIAILIYGICAKDGSWITLGGAVTALGLAYGIYNAISIYRAPKRIREQNKEICENGVTYSYKFKEKSCDIVAKIGTKNNKVTYTYEDFKKVYEFQDKYEIRLATGEVMYVLKDSFTTEKAVEFFKKNLGTNKKLKFIDKTAK